MRYPSGLLDRYRSLAFVVGHTALLLVELNLVLSIVFLLKEAYVRHQQRSAVPEAALRAVYPGMAVPEIQALLSETRHRPLVYEPFTGFRERHSVGKYVNVNEAGFRASTGREPWPPDRSKFNVFLFGGSTTFGYGVADDQTLASFLGERLSAARLTKEPCVYNFGRAAYYSDHERILFERLLTEGTAPDLAIFIDGLNDTLRDEPFFTQRLREIFDAFDHRSAYFLRGLFEELPMGRALAYLQRSASSPRLDRVVEAEPQTGRNQVEPGRVSKVVDRYLANKALIEAAAGPYGLSVAFVWQPLPVYKYDLAHHPFWKEGYALPRAVAAYTRMAELAKERDMGAQFLWCADMQEHLKEPLYVDPIHYSGRMADRLAALIARLLLERRLLPGVD